MKSQEWEKKHKAQEEKFSKFVYSGDIAIKSTKICVDQKQTLSTSMLANRKQAEVTQLQARIQGK